MIEPDEIWKPVKGYEGSYEVSSLGAVRSRDREVTQKGSTWFYRGQVLSQDVSKAGYPRVVLSQGNRRSTRQVHRLMAEAFLPNPTSLPLVRHLDDVKSHNVIENLSWGTVSDNGRDAVRNGTHPKSRKTHCPSGHPYAGSNLYEKNGVRKCRKCHALLERKRRKVSPDDRNT